MANIEQRTQGTEKAKFYTHAVVSYATITELQPLLDCAKHYAYIYHDRDEHRSPHYHLLITFDIARSYNSVRSLVNSAQNTFTQKVKTTIGNVFTYFVHATDSAIAYGKEPYDESEVILDDEAYWRKRALQDGAGWKDQRGQSELNEEFIKDIIDSNLSRFELGKKYGKDYIKNFRAYEYFKNAVYEQRYWESLKTLDGTPAQIDQYTGQPLAYHATLTPAEYELVLESRRQALESKYLDRETKESIRNKPIEIIEKH